MRRGLYGPGDIVAKLDDPGIDEGFLRRVYLASAAASLAAGGALALYAGGAWGLGFAVAGLWSTANLWALELLIRAALRPRGRDPLAIGVAFVVKLPLLYGVGALLALKGGFPPLALIAGFGVPLAIVVLKAAGRLVAPRVALPERPMQSRHPMNGS